MGDMRFIPSEVEIAGVYAPPMLVNGMLGLFLLLLTVNLIKRYRLSRYLAFPEVALLALWAIYTTAFSLWIIPA